MDREGFWRERHTLCPFRPNSLPRREEPNNEVRDVASQPIESFPVTISPSSDTPRVANVTARS